MINFKTLPAVPKSLLAEEEQVLRKYSPSTPCDIMLPLESIKKVIKTQGNIGQNLEINKLLFKGKMAFLIELFNSKLNGFLTPEEQKIAQSVIEKDFRQAFGQEMRKIIDIPDNYLHDLGTELINEGEKESKMYKKVFNSKAYKRYIQTSKSLEGCRVKLIDLEDIISQREAEIINLKKEFNQTQEEDVRKALAHLINSKIDESAVYIQEYNRLLTKVYAPKVASMRQDARAIEQHLNEIRNVDYILPAEAIIGKPLKNPRDKNFNIIT